MVSGDAAHSIKTENPIIDCHAHIFDSDMPTCPDAWTVPDYGFSDDDLLGQMDQYGVHFAVLAGLSISGYYNDYMIRALRCHKRLRGTVIIDPRTDLYTLEKMAEDGIVGVRLQLARCSQTPDFSAQPYRTLLRRIRDLGWHVQIAIEGPQLRAVTEPLLAAGVNLVIDHFGHPDPSKPLECDGFHAMLEAVDSGRCWVKLSGGFRLPGPTAWRDNPDADLESTANIVAAGLLDKVGTDRLLWGSDAPYVGYEKRISYDQILTSYKNWVPDAAKRAEIDRTALRFYFS